MGKLIQIPYIKQPRNSAKCGAACAAMVIKHYTGDSVSIDDIWGCISAISPEKQREYCSTYKIGAYISNNYFNCSSIKYSSLGKLLEFCNDNGIAPIINHKSFESNIAGHFSGHFSVVKNISGNDVVINDPENKNRIIVSLQELASMATKNSLNDEVGGNTAIVPSLDIFPHKTRSCPKCEGDIDISFSCAANAIQRIVEQDLCQNCDKFSPAL